MYKIRDSSHSCLRHLRINSCLQLYRVNSRKCLGLGFRLQNEDLNANMISGPWQVHLQAMGLGDRQYVNVCFYHYTRKKYSNHEFAYWRFVISFLNNMMFHLIFV